MDHAPSRRTLASPCLPGAGRNTLILFGSLGALLFAYLVYLVSAKGGGSLLVNGWLISAMQIFVSGLCVSRGVGRARIRVVPLVLGCAPRSWALGDGCLPAESVAAAPPPTPSVADAFYLSF